MFDPLLFKQATGQELVSDQGSDDALDTVRTGRETCAYYYDHARFWYLITLWMPQKYGEDPENRRPDGSVDIGYGLGVQPQPNRLIPHLEEETQIEPVVIAGLRCLWMPKANDGSLTCAVGRQFVVQVEPQLDDLARTRILATDVLSRVQSLE